MTTLTSTKILVVEDEAIIAEVEKIRDRHLSVMVRVAAGDRNKRTSWYEVMGSDGDRIWAIYHPAPLDQDMPVTNELARAKWTGESCAVANAGNETQLAAA